MLFSILAATAMSAETSALRVGTYSYPRYDRIEALQPLADLVEHETGRRVDIVLLSTPSLLSKAVCEGEVDVAMMNLAAFVQVRECPDAQPIAVLDTPATVLEKYRGVLVTRRDRRLAKFSALKKRAASLRYSEVLPGSTSGALVQANALRALGLTPSSFKEVRQSGIHEMALDDVLEGRSDVAAMAEEPWNKLQTDRPMQAAKLRILWRSAPLPPGPLVCRNSEALRCEALASVLVSPAGINAATKLSGGWAETEGATRFLKYDEADYRLFVASR